MVDINKCTIFANKQLENRYKIPVCIIIFQTLVISLINFVTEKMFPLKDILSVNLLSINSDPKTSLEFLSNNKEILLKLFGLVLLSFFISCIINYARTKVFIKMSRTADPVTLMDFIEGFAKILRAILANLWIFFCIFAWSFCISFITIIIISISGVNIIGTVLPFICILIIYKYLEYSFSIYIAVEYEKIKITKIVQISKFLTQGAKWQIFKTILIFYLPTFLVTLLFSTISATVEIPMIIENIIILILDCILIPKMTMILINIYHSQQKNAVESSLILPEVFEQ